MQKTGNNNKQRKTFRIIHFQIRELPQGINDIRNKEIERRGDCY